MTKPSLASCALLLLAACSSGGDDAAGGESENEEPDGITASSEESCSEVGWRSPTPGAVTCPGADGCSCDGGAVCCVEVAEVGTPNERVADATCRELTACAELAFACDGPEDCQPGKVCCATLTAGGGSSCVDPIDCYDGDAAALCRSDADCLEATGAHCNPAVEGSYFDGTTAACVN